MGQIFEFDSHINVENIYSKMMFLGLTQVYYWGFKCNTYNCYNYIIKTKWNYNWILFTTEREAPSKVSLGFG